MKRLIALICCVCLLTGMLPVMAVAADGNEEIIIDCLDSQWSCHDDGKWQESSNVNCKGPKENNTKYSNWNSAWTCYDLSGVEPGRYDLYVYNLYYAVKSDNAKAEITTADGTYSGYYNPAGIASVSENKWVALGTYILGAQGDQVVFTNLAETSNTYRDAGIKLVPNAEGEAVTPELTEYTAPSQPEEAAELIIDSQDDRWNAVDKNWFDTGNANCIGPKGNKSKYTDWQDGASAYNLSAVTAGRYDLYVYNLYFKHTTTDVLVEITSAEGAASGHYNPAQLAESEENRWVALGTYTFGVEGDQVMFTSKDAAIFRDAGIKLVPNAEGAAVEPELTGYEMTEEVIIDCQDNQWSSADTRWTSSGSDKCYGPKGRPSKYNGWLDASVCYDLSEVVAGRYDLYVYNLHYSHPTTDVLVEVTAAENTASGHYNPNALSSSGENQWVGLGTYTFGTEGCQVVFTNKANVNFRDAGIKLVPNPAGADLTPELTDYTDSSLTEEIVEPRTIPENSYILLGSEDGGFTMSKGWKQSGITLPTGKGYYGGSQGLWAKWMLHLNAAEDVTLWYLVPSITQNEDPLLKVEVFAEGEIHTVELDFTTGEPRWVELGTFDFDGSFTEYVKIIRQDTTEPNSTSRLTNVRVGYASAFEVEEVESVYSGTDKEILQRLNLLTGTEDGITAAYIQSVPTKADLDVIELKLNGKLVEAENYSGTDTTAITANDYAAMLLEQMGYVCGSDFEEGDVLSFFNETVGTDVTVAQKFTVDTMADMTVAALETNMKGEKRALLGSVMGKMEPIVELTYTNPSVFTEEMRQARETAKNKDRTLIYNNDGNDVYEAYEAYPGPFDTSEVPDEEVTIENFLAQRMTGLEYSQVDSVFYCTGVTGSYHHASELENVDLRQRDWAPLLIEKFKKDSLTVIEEWCKEYDREFMWSMRMNDHHDRKDPDEYLNTFKRENKDLLVCDRSNMAIDMVLAPGYWACVDYGEQEVRQWIYDILREVLLNYDVDGIELDFSRTGVFFEQLVKEGEDVNAENLERMNNLLRSLRTLTEQVSAQKGKPILIAVHLADSVAYSKATGLDVEQWLEEDLVDMISIRSFGAWQSMEDALADYEGYDIPVYLVMDAIAATASGYDWSKEAGLAYHLGYDGIQVFNHYNPNSSFFNILGSSETTEYDPAYVEKTLAETGDYLTFAKDSAERFMSYQTDKTLWFTESEVEKAAGDRNFTIAAVSNAVDAVTYSSSDPDVAFVDPETALVQICGVGTAVITASANGVSDSYILSVTGTMHAVSMPEGVTGPESAVFQMDYTFTSEQSVMVTVGGHVFTDLVVNDSTYTIPGEFVTGDVVITVEESEPESDPEPDQETFEGSVTVKENVSLEVEDVKFSDVKEAAWYADAVNYVTSEGIMNGVGGGAFAPDSTTTRAMIVTMLYRMEGQPKVTAGNPFTDVAAEQYYTEAVIWAAEESIVKGMDENTFAPDAPITREQLAAILYRFAQFKRSNEADAEGSLAGFADETLVSEYAVSAMQWAVAANLINGIDGKLCPQETATRAQVAMMLMRFNKQ